MSVPLLNSINVRPLTSTDSSIYWALRQKILKSRDARYFSDSYERERRLTEGQWLEWCTEKREHCILGTFDGVELVGIIMVTQQGTTDRPVVEWEAAWLDPRYRGTGIGKSSYERARQWSQAQGYEFVAGFIRETYTPALDICRNQGFIYVYTIQDELWADGSVADTHAYILDLRPDAYRFASEPVQSRFKEAFPFLSQGYHAPAHQGETEAA
jgi:GNAT superfamily N-acetyltransferase